MSTLNSRLLRFASLFTLLLTAASARAQAPLEPADLPARTIFYIVWRGAPAADVRHANSLYALWDDPGFKPVRDALAEGFLKDANKGRKSAAPAAGKKDVSSSASQAQKAPKRELTREDVDNFASLFDNGFVLGYIGAPEGSATAAPAASKPAAPAWNGFFLVYNRAGKEAIIDKFISDMQHNPSKDEARIAPVTIAGLAALEIKGKDSTSYVVQNGKFLVLAQEKPVAEALLKRLLGQTPAAEKSLASNDAFREARASLAPNGVLDFFVRMPDLSDFPAPQAGPPAQPGMPALKPEALIKALRLDAVHSFCGTVLLDGPRTRFQGGILGDTSRGTLFDIWGAGPVSPAMSGFASADVVSFSQTQFDLQGILELARRVAASFLPPGQTGMIDMVEAGIAGKIGMSLSEAMDLFTGDFGSFQSGTGFDPARQLYVLGIRKKPETLKLLRTLLNERVASERSENGVTFLKISLSSSQGKAGVAQWNFYHLAVTDGFILGAPSHESLRTALAQPSPSASALTSSPRFREFRSQLPSQPNGLGFGDFARVDWAAAKQRWLTSSKPAPKRTSGAAPAADAPPAWLVNWDASVIGRHLHTAGSASWKDAKGLHFDGWLD
ncbi:MAG TPA: hypothetical protein VEH49_07200 [Methylomirabilota bacterium]|nr:hypothetical protein [Methylomirabilota bacterium]